eukprot:6456593-Amphidinium_carterae.1
MRTGTLGILAMQSYDVRAMDQATLNDHQRQPGCHGCRATICCGNSGATDTNQTPILSCCAGLTLPNQTLQPKALKERIPWDQHSSCCLCHGAQVANPNSLTILIDGDGSFNMTNMELQTIKRSSLCGTT